MIGGSVRAADALRVLDARQYHLGVEGFPEWNHFAGRSPHGRDLTLTFEAKSNATEHALFIRQEDVKQRWEVKLNGKRLGFLDNMETRLLTPLAIPPGTLRDGSNELAIVAPKAVDDILVGEFLLAEKPLKELLSAAQIRVEVADGDSSAPLPCRITVVEERGALAPVHPAPGQELAVRTGVLYTRDGQATFGVLPGNYTIYAGRGFEYSVATQQVAVATGESKSVALSIRREVPTPGWVAVDTHIHNLTFSGHGDASIDEGMLTIAGEGIELAVATDHNHHTDYTEAALKMKVREHFTAVIGNEVTTKAGHFNAFPIRPGATLPDHTLTNWPDLFADIRLKTGARVIQLNHPRDLHGGFTPLGQPHFNPVTGAHAKLGDASFDAMEVVTSAALQSDPLLLLHDWFALLNHGRRVTALGSSDTHYVSRMILGQGRSYVAGDDRDPARLDLEAAMTGFIEGRVLVSMGLLAHLKVDGRFGVGDLATNLTDTIRVELTVLGPRWVEATRVILFANGVPLREQAISGSLGRIEKANLAWQVPRPAHDVHLVAVATGPGVTAPFWEIPRAYQASSKDAATHVIGATNPVWLDADGDGRFTSARAYAQRAWRQHQRVRATGEDLSFLNTFDEAVAAQAADLMAAAGKDLDAAPFREALAKAPTHVQRGFEAFQQARSRQ
jgi:hypothetical protein